MRLGLEPAAPSPPPPAPASPLSETDPEDPASPPPLATTGAAIEGHFAAKDFMNPFVCTCVSPCASREKYTSRMNSLDKGTGTPEDLGIKLQNPASLHLFRREAQLRTCGPDSTSSGTSTGSYGE